MVEVMLNRLAEVSFKLFNVYKGLVDLDINKKNDPNYKDLRKVLIDKIATLRSDEEEVYDELRSNPTLAGSCLFYFNQRRSAAQSVNSTVHVMDLSKEYTIVQERIQSALEMICLEKGVISTNINNDFIDFLCNGMKSFDKHEAINTFVLLQKRFTTSLTLKSFKFSDDFFEGVDQPNFLVNMINRKHFRTFIDRDAEADRLKNGFSGYTMRLKEESKNEYGIDEEIMDAFHENLALQFLKDNLLALLASDVCNSSVSLLFDVQSALLYLDDEALQMIYLATLVCDAKEDVIKQTLLAAIKQTKEKKKLFNSDLDTTKDF